MKSKDRESSRAKTKPQKVLLHMARKDGEWAGVATNFKTEKILRFQSLRELVNWLDQSPSDDQDKAGR